MPALSLTDFVDVVIRNGTSKINKVSQIKHRPPYEPAFDFYKYAREHIQEIHKNGGSKKDLNDIMASLTDARKLPSYDRVVQGYRKWWGRKLLVWFEPPSALFSRFGVDVRINPELGLEINGTPHLIKLYFKDEEVTKHRVEVIAHLMSVSLAATTPANTVMTVLDARNSRLHAPQVPIAKLNAALDGELAYIAATWTNL